MLCVCGKTKHAQKWKLHQDSFFCAGQNGNYARRKGSTALGATGLPVPFLLHLVGSSWFRFDCLNDVIVDHPCQMHQVELHGRAEGKGLVDKDDWGEYRYPMHWCANTRMQTEAGLGNECFLRPAITRTEKRKSGIVIIYMNRLCKTQ